MRNVRWNHPGAVLAAGGLTVALVAAPGLPVAVAGGQAVGAGQAVAGGEAVAGGRAPGPVLKLVAAQHNVTLDSFGGEVYLDPGIWVAALRSPLQFDVRRASYPRPFTITQVIRAPGGRVVRRPLPAQIVQWNGGLRGFLTLTARNSAGRVAVSQSIPFCPDTYDPERASPSGSAATPYPQQCDTNPFMKGMVWGMQAGWATDPAESNFLGHQVKLALGTYHVTAAISPVYRRMFGISARDAAAAVTVKVVKGPKCCPVPGCCAPAAARSRQRAGPPPAGAAVPHAATPHAAMPRAGATVPSASTPPAGATVPYTATPPASALPDLIALPAWRIATSHSAKTGTDYLTFGATVWIGGNGPLDVEGFRLNASPVMNAYQYFWQGGHLVGRVRAGTMGFDSKQGHNHWHFEQFARYTLLNSARSVTVTSHKVGFCIAPSDEMNLLLPRAVWQPAFVGLTGRCGSPTALWVAEEMPVGWGDTYIQVAGQSFDITHVPNGTYYIEVTANPLRVLHETTTRNDVSLRKVILSGTPGDRTVKVPAWHGIDPEH